MKERTKKLHLAIELTVLLAVVFMALFPAEGSSYRRFATDTLRYVRATVLEVTSETLSSSTMGTGQKLGEQTLRVRLSDGQEVTLTNYLTETHNILLKKGDSAIICADEPDNAAPYYTVYNYDRTIPLMGLAAVFVLLLVLVGRRKGADACLSILFTLAFILRVLLPSLYSGASPVGMGLVTVLLSTSVTLLLIHSVSVQCLLSICATMIGELIACGLFAVFSQLLHLTGFQTDSAEGLLLIAQNTGLNIRMLLFAGMMIASLGAVMDVAVSVLSAVREVALASGHPKRKTLFLSAMRLGQDMIGTMSNTLIFAFAGSALITMLVFCSYGVQFHQILSSDYLAVELAQGVCSTAAVILTVPASAIISAGYYGKPAKSA
jgi:uncharacterized membrane protein